MVAELVPQPHPILACATEISARLSEVADLQAIYLSASDKRAALLALNTAQRQLAELNLRVMAASADIAEQDGARDVAAWLAPRRRARLQLASPPPPRPEIRLRPPAQR